MNHTASGLPRPDRTKRRGAGTKHTTNRNTLLLKLFCVTRKKLENRVGEHESIDYIYFVTITRNAVRLACVILTFRVDLQKVILTARLKTLPCFLPIQSGRLRSYRSLLLTKSQISHVLVMLHKPLTSNVSIKTKMNQSEWLHVILA